MSEKIQIESKQDLKDRLGKEASPDRSDVIVMALRLGMKRRPSRAP